MYIVVFWGMTPCSVVSGYQPENGVMYCSGRVAPTYLTRRCHNPEDNNYHLQLQGPGPFYTSTILPKMLTLYFVII
jgi:hypothetical protein